MLVDVSYSHRSVVKLSCICCTCMLSCSGNVMNCTVCNCSVTLVYVDWSFAVLTLYLVSFLCRKVGS